MDDHVTSSGLDNSPSQMSSCSTTSSTQQGPTSADSGYASKEDSQVTEPPKRRYLFRILKGKPQIAQFASFDTVVLAPSVCQRFHDLQELFNDSLSNQLNTAYLRAGPITIKLKVLGETRESAKPCVVVQCNKKVSKKIKQFFDQPHVKAQYQPCDGINPDLEVVVRPWPPILKALEILHRLYSPEEEKNLITPWTLNGAETARGLLIKVDIDGVTKFATLGGLLVIKRTIKRDEKESDVETYELPKLYGFTVGHIFQKSSPEAHEESDSTDSAQIYWDNSDIGSLDDPMAIDEDSSQGQDFGTEDQCTNENNPRPVANADLLRQREALLIDPVSESGGSGAGLNMTEHQDAYPYVTYPSSSASDTSLVDAAELERRQANYRGRISKGMELKTGAENLLEALSVKSTKETRDQRRKVESELNSLYRVVTELKSQLRQETEEFNGLTKPIQEHDQVIGQHGIEAKSAPNSGRSHDIEQTRGLPVLESVFQTKWTGIGQATRSSTVSRNGMSFDWALVEITNASYLVSQNIEFEPEEFGTDHIGGARTLLQRTKGVCGKDALELFYNEQREYVARMSSLALQREFERDY